MTRPQTTRTAGERVTLPSGVVTQLAAYREALGLSERDWALDVAVFFYTGTSARSSGAVDEAVSCFKKVIELVPDDPFAYWELADLYVEQGTPRPGVIVLSTLGERLAAREQWIEAASAWKRAAELAPDDVDVLEALRSVSERAGRPHDAAEVASTIRKLRERLGPSPEPHAVEPTRAGDGGPGQAAGAGQADDGPGTALAGGAASMAPEIAAEPEIEIIPHAPEVVPENEDTPSGAPAGGAAIDDIDLGAIAPGAPPPRAQDAAPPAGPLPSDAVRSKRMRSGVLEEILLREGWVNKDQLTQALQLQQRNRMPIGHILLEMGVLSEEQLGRGLAQQWGLPYLALSESSVDPSVGRLIPAYLARRHGVMPVQRKDDRLVVAMPDPSNVLAIDDIRLVTGLEVEIIVSSPSDIMRVHPVVYEQVDIEQVFKDAGASMDKVGDDAAAQVEDISIESLRSMVEEGPIIRAVNQILTQAVTAGASDIHIEPHHHDVKVRFRIDGMLQDVMSPPKAVQAPLISRVKILASMDIAERRLPQDGHIHIRTEGRELDLRVSTLPTVLGEKVVIRILDQARTKVTLPQLGFAGDLLNTWESLITKPYGMILVTGPTGSGKTTTLYTSLSRINTPERNIVSVEDPVEYQIPRVNQVQVSPRIGLTFANGLRTILRQDPDVVLIGEIRDRETAEIAVQASMTGHLVLSTVHTNDAPGAVTRLIDMGVEPFLITSSLIGVLAQRLTRVICEKCKEAYVPPVDALRRLGLENSKEEVRLYRGAGCEKCRNSGYRGRVGVFELMVMDDTLRKLALAGGSSDVLREAAQKAGMRTLREAGILRVLEGVTTFEEMLRVVFVGE